RVDATDRHAHQRGGISVLERGAHGRAQSRTVNAEPRQRDERGGRDDHEQPQRRDAERSKRERRRRKRMRDRARDAAPHEELGVLHRDPDADHHQHDGVDRVTAQRTQQGALGQRAEQGAGGDGHAEGRQKRQPGERQRREGGVGPERVELAVREVHHAHEAEDQGETDAEQRVGAAQHQAVHQVLQELLHYFFMKSGSATLPSRTCTMKIDGLLWPLSLPAGPSFSNLIGPFTPVNDTFHSASWIAFGSSLPAILIASTMVAMPSWPRNPSVSPSNGLPRLFHSSTNALASLASGIASGNHGMKKTM